ncbi:hypothetical protein [Rhizobium fabae]|uniref:Uncharacterized protein n=1 Tax=Rhizobium fabae TaxID=573179 RepID=A0A7W6BD32_9HYPH|nr:hypothetical protein [Rhizobium fabae]MBB3917949.1 hypothetical protein [Rhizobium fabae]RUM09606.1 hypothetical protein EFB14_25650 [Rhizobium fabae]
MSSKKPRKVYPQEALVATFAKHSISSPSTFLPDQWSSGREPADMIIVIGRALFMFNMKDSKAWLKGVAEENLRQARDRIAEWKLGRQIRGKNEWQSFAVAWDDIDYIHVVSVIDGPHAACLDHPALEQNMDEKVCLCTTLTSDVLRELVVRAGGARDLITLCVSIKGRGILPTQIVKDELANRHVNLIQKAKETFPEAPTSGLRDPHTREPISWFEAYMVSARLLRAGLHADPHSTQLSDLSWNETIPAAAFISQCVRRMEGIRLSPMRSAAFGEQAKYRVVVGSIDAVKVNPSKFRPISEQEGSYFTLLVMVTPAFPNDLLLFNDPPKVLATEMMLQALRG